MNALNDLRVMIVEDEIIQREMIVAMLQSLGLVQVSAAENGRHALEKLDASAESPVDVVICDLNMPEMDGLEFLRNLGERQAGISVIIASGMTGRLIESAAKMSRLYAVNLIGAIEKPVLPEQLKRILGRHYELESVPQPRKDGREFTLEEVLHGFRENQFTAYFQPKADIKTCRLQGGEALVRWIHPELGLIGPDAFIPQLERSGHIDELTFRMLEMAAATCRKCHGNGHQIAISVNLSLASLGDIAFADKVQQIVKQEGIDPRFLTLEVTESAAMADIAHALENLTRLRMNGFGLSIDDYGTGYSSMQQLVRIPFSELKIDKSFVKDLDENRASRIVVESSIEMANKLRIKSVAEGVESLADWEALADVHCDIAQGYFISRPISEEQFYQFVAESSRRISTKVKLVEDQQKNIRILLIDDDDFTRKMLARMLEGIGYTDVTEVDCAKSALRLLKDQVYDLLISDIDMPEMNGLELVQMIRAGKTQARADIRIVMQSVYSSTDVLGKAIALDVNGFLVKPLTIASVEEKIAQALNERLHLHTSLAYEAVQTNLRKTGRHTHNVPARADAAITIGDNRKNAENRTGNTCCLSLFRLHPGMLLCEDVYLADGTLLLSSGHTLSEPSINRLRDFSASLTKKEISVIRPHLE